MSNCTIKEFKEWLTQFPEDAMIDCVSGRRGRNWDGDSYVVVSFVPETVPQKDETLYGKDAGMVSWYESKTFVWDGDTLTIGAAE